MNWFHCFLRREALVALLCLPALPAFSWGQKGHDVTAAIAQRHLTPRTAAAVDSLLCGQSMVYCANWLDNASHTPRYAYSKTWHYKNIDSDETFETAQLNPGGDIISALKEQKSILGSRILSKEQGTLALKMLIHLMGDLHQPMHMGRRSDRGGNNRPVKFLDTPTNLHSLWDTALPEAVHDWSYTEWVEQIDRAGAPLASLIVQGDFADWGKETYSVATEVYELTPPDALVSYDYIAYWTLTVEHQFLKGGLRLAHVLNSIFDPCLDPSCRAE